MKVVIYRNPGSEQVWGGESPISYLHIKEYYNGHYLYARGIDRNPA